MALPIQDDEDAAQLKFPKEFDKAEPMMISEVLLMLEQRRQQHTNSNNNMSNLGIDDDDDEITLSEAFNDTVAYCERFSKFKTKEAIGAVRNLLFPKDQTNGMTTTNSTPGLHKFEAALLANLCPQQAIEAKTLIPSLDSKLDDDECQKIVDEIQTYRSFQC
ncbi:unnamed protein product [Rotaria sordida]|uniref:RNA polymerase Rpb4/RPC9 core domain-containing protein n=1 Tax=Rotaria sordida TaxID=392033 RepID=A0A813TAP7_9BILA|nr:unnamed protein product [Rotaria sordida]CAF0807060.1 unnamed protein product [Rotaria sordida]CAF0834319.1 unnamed protein product [Rotaria sordida]CAF0835247.1 unnamed protein product [Rotaria sordida]CAF0838786.1 unnamed protein product [Rotaria sordida]